MSKPIGHKNHPACLGEDKCKNICPLRGACARFHIVELADNVYFEWAPFRMLGNQPRCSYRVEKADHIDTSGANLSGTN